MNDFIKKPFFRPINGDKITPQIGEWYEYSVFEPDVRYCCADPFLCEEDDQIYVYYECYMNEKHKGSIELYEP